MFLYACTERHKGGHVMNKLRRGYYPILTLVIRLVDALVEV